MGLSDFDHSCGRVFGIWSSGVIIIGDAIIADSLVEVCIIISGLEVLVVSAD